MTLVVDGYFTFRFQSVGCHTSLHVFFFQAEDGIRDLVRSRGLGDVYKRQVAQRVNRAHRTDHAGADDDDVTAHSAAGTRMLGSVSYTHLTLPTSDLV